jgi:hypothetical protein
VAISQFKRDRLNGERFRLIIFFIDNTPGNHNKEETPVPIPNTEVKLFSADGTAWVTEWESRKLPGFFMPKKRGQITLSSRRETVPEDKVACSLCSVIK